MPAMHTRVPLLATAGAALLGLGLLVVPSPADAVIYMGTSGGGACKPAYSASNKFIFNNLYAENIGTTDQYLVCHFTNWDVNTGQFGQPIEQLRVWFSAGATTGTATCTARMGAWLSSAFTSSTSTKTVVISTGSVDVIQFFSGDLPRTIEYYTLTLNCKLPGGFKLGLIQRNEPEPTSGHAWTP